MAAGDDLQLAGELTCENAQVRCHLQVGCDLNLAGNLFVGGSIFPPPPPSPPPVIQDEGVPLAGAPHTVINYVGAGVTATNAGGGVATVSVPFNPAQAAIGALFLASLNAPNLTGGIVNNYSVPGSQLVTIVRLMCTAPTTITGFTEIAPGQAMGRILIFLNRISSTAAVTIASQNVGSIPVNRFQNGSASLSFVIGPGGAAGYQYDVGGTPRWLQLFGVP
jgi:hypothetical protein